MRKLIVAEFITLDGVMQAPGGPEEDREGGFQFGGKQLYPTVFEKAAAMLESLACNHAFVDGNKRTALVATARFFWINGYDLSASNTAVERYILSLVQQKPGIGEIAQWLKKNSQKRSRNKLCSSSTSSNAQTTGLLKMMWT